MAAFLIWGVDIYIVLIIDFFLLWRHIILWRLIW